LRLLLLKSPPLRPQSWSRRLHILQQ